MAASARCPIPRLRRPKIRGSPRCVPRDMKRVLTALAMIPAVVWVVLFADAWIFLAVLAASACLCWHEYNEIAGAYGFGKPGIVGYGAGLALLFWWDVTWFAVTA